jgi:hypothetical protein
MAHAGATIGAKPRYPQLCVPKIRFGVDLASGRRKVAILMTDLFKLILGILASRFKARATLEAENLVLRQQVNVLRRRTPKRPHLNNTDRFLFVWLYRWVSVRP